MQKADVWDASLDLIQPVVQMMADLPPDTRIHLLSLLLVQEFCMMPPGDRRPELLDWMEELPAMLAESEAAMRDVLAETAKGETD